MSLSVVDDSIVAESSSLPSTHLQEPVPQAHNQTNCIFGDSNSSPTDKLLGLQKNNSWVRTMFLSYAWCRPGQIKC